MPPPFPPTRLQPRTKLSYEALLPPANHMQSFLPALPRLLRVASNDHPSHYFFAFCFLVHLLKCGSQPGACHCHCVGLATGHQIQQPNGCVLSAPPLGFFQLLKLLTSFLLEMLPVTSAFGNPPSCVRACVLSFSYVSLAESSFLFPWGDLWLVASERFQRSPLLVVTPWSVSCVGRVGLCDWIWQKW